MGNSNSIINYMIRDLSHNNRNGDQLTQELTKPVDNECLVISNPNYSASVTFEKAEMAKCIM